MREVRLFVSVVSQRDCKTAFVSSAIGLTFHIARHGVAGCVLKKFWFKIFNGGLCMSRQMALNEAIEGGYSHLLFIDDDMSYPSNIVDMLMQHNKPIMACNYARRHLLPAIGTSLGFDDKFINSKNKKGIEEVKSVGFGMILIDIEAVKHIPAPHFEMTWNAERKTYVGEDVTFCHKMRENGVPVFIDHDASNMMGHVGEFTFAFCHAEDERSQIEGGLNA